MSKPKVAIIGGGVSGVTTALLLQDTFDVTIYERENDILLKLLKTGNGKANIYNRGIKLESYNDQTFMREHYALIEQTLDTLFTALHIVTYTDESGRVYPFSRSARGLKRELENKLYVRLLLNTNIAKIETKGHNYIVNNEAFSYVFITTGSSAGLFKRSLANDNETLLQSAHLAVNDFTPVIKTIAVKENLHALKHERVDARLTLYENDKKLVSDRGEILFKEDGLSGIVSFVISSYFEWASKDQSNLKIAIDFMPDHTLAEVRNLLKGREGLSHIFAPRVALFLEQSKSKDKVSLIKHYVLTPVSGNYPENSQAMNGGVKVMQISKYFHLVNDDHFFVLGEALDIDGICGGYNLGFAFYAAFVASNYLLDKMSKRA